MKENDFNFLSKDISLKEKDLFFGPIDLENESWFEIEERDIMAHIMFKVGAFPSINMARKNGWNKPIPNGFSEFKVGKRKLIITIFNKETAAQRFPES